MEYCKNIISSVHKGTPFKFQVSTLDCHDQNVKGYYDIFNISPV